MDKKNNTLKDIIVPKLPYFIFILVIVIIFCGVYIHDEIAVRRNFDEHFGDVHLSDEEIESLAKSIVDPSNETTDVDNEYTDEAPEILSNTMDSDSRKDSDFILDESAIISNSDFQSKLSEALAYIGSKNIDDFHIELDGSDDRQLFINAYVQTDVRPLCISMSYLFITKTWIFFDIKDANTGHQYYCPDEAKGYFDVYDYYTDELISSKYID